LWGQYDQLSSFILILALFMLSCLMFNKTGKKQRLILVVLSFLLCILSIQIKATGIFFIPLFLMLYLMSRPSIKEIISISSVSIAINYLLAMIFTPGGRSVFMFIREIIIPKIFYERRFLLSNQAFNFWQGLGALIEIKLEGGLWVKIAIVTIVILLTSLAALVLIKNRNIKTFWVSLYIVIAGNYLFNIGMMNRYFYTAIIVMGILTVYYPKIIKYWILALIIFSLNLYYSWGYPAAVGIWDVFWGNRLWVFLLSFGNILIYFMALKETGCYKKIKRVNNA